MHDWRRRRGWGMLVGQFVVALCVAGAASPVAGNYTLADGQLHSFTSNAEIAHLYLYDGPHAQPTSVYVQWPARVSHLYAFDQSRVEAYATQIAHLNMLDQSTATVNHADVSHVRAYGTSLTEFYNGSLSHAYTFEEARLNIYDGRVGSATASGTPPFNPPWPYQPLLSSKSEVTIFGGLVSNATAVDSGTLEILGGRVLSIFAQPDGIANVRGGLISNLSLSADSYTSVYGQGLVLTPTESDDPASPDYVLSGILLDDSPIAANVFMRNGAVLRLINVPEPSSAGLLGCGMILAMVGWNRRRKRVRVVPAG